ncbi:putative lipid-binding protein At4g00165 [Malania oleifera]|uniref:putative lipid-binding protein At4g00165 n=1 Tax=Malania oleifera TaxID=397392 RepID=UPI0025ADF0FD|nr:putative lipid-binding protein At4g00165 [Malania oleifera]
MHYLKMAFTKGAALLIFLNMMLPFTAAFSSHNKLPFPPKTPVAPPSVPSAPKRPDKCPRDTLKFGVCSSWLGVVNEVIGAKPSQQCCALLKGLAELEAAVCLCTAIQANVLGAAVKPNNIPITLTLLVNACGKKVPQGFLCE